MKIRPPIVAQGVIPENTWRFRIYYYANTFTGGTLPIGTVVNGSCIFQVSRIETNAEAYQARSVTVPLLDAANNNASLTVYGGTLDVTTGELTVTHAAVTFDGSESGWAVLTTGSGEALFYRQVGDMNAVDDLLCDSYPAIPVNATWTGSAGVSSQTNANPGKQFLLTDPANLPQGSSTADLLLWLSEHPITISYRLATPVTYQLTPQSLAALPGYNAVYANAGSVSVTYKADPSIALGG